MYTVHCIAERMNVEICGGMNVQNIFSEIMQDDVLNVSKNVRI